MNNVETTTERNCNMHGRYPVTTTVGGITGRLMCPECKREHEERCRLRDEEWNKELRLQRIASNRKAAAIPSRFVGCTFGTYVAKTDAQQRALSTAQAFAEQFDQAQAGGSSLALCGNPGCGKTHLACAVANHLIEAGRQVAYVQLIELIRSIRDTWQRGSSESESEVIARFRKVDLLILDEVGVSFGTENERTHLFDVLDGRYRDMRPTLIVSNLTAKSLEEALGVRVYDRLMQNGSAVVVFSWESHRRQGPPTVRQTREGDTYTPPASDGKTRTETVNRETPM